MPVDDCRKGWLSGWFGTGPDETKKTQVTISHSSAPTSIVGSTITNSLHFSAEPTELYSVAIYCDVIFGTFAMQLVPVFEHPILSGLLSDLKGRPVFETEVTLFNNGKQFTTLTDSSGRYAFHAGTIKSGDSTLIAGAARKRFALSLPRSAEHGRVRRTVSIDLRP